VGQVIFRDLAIVDNNSGDCPAGVGSPFFLITNTVVHFENVSIRGTKSGLNACNDAFILGSNVAACVGSGTNDCFGGYGSNFQNIYTSNTRRIALFNAAANGTDWNYIFGDSTNGSSNTGVAATGSAIEFNATNATAELYPYGNTFKNLAIEQGPYMGSQRYYKYGLDVIANAGPNYVFGITCSDIPVHDPNACVHIGDSPNNVLPQMVLGCNTSANDLTFPGCVARDNIGSYSDMVADLFNGTSTFFAQTMYGASLGSRDPIYEWNYLYLYDLDLVPTTVANLPFHSPPPLPLEGMIASVSDGQSATDCTSGGGSTLVTCRYDGSAWVAFGSGNVDGPSSSAANDIPYFSDSTGKSLADTGILYTNVPTMASAGATGHVIISAGLKTLQDSGTPLSSLSGIGPCTSQVVTGLNGNSAPTCNTVTHSYVDPSICSDSSCTQSTTGTASNLSGMPALPNGTTATTQSAYAGDTRLATDNYVDNQTKPVFSTAVTGLSMSASAGIVISGPTTMVASPNTGTYRINFQIIPTAAGSGGGLCTQGAVAISLGYKDADTATTFSVGTSGVANENVLFYPLNSNALAQTASFSSTVGTVGTIFTGVPRDIRVASGTAITYQVWQVVLSNCSTPPVFALRPAVWYLGY
jgi:hypothetical protein